MDAVWTLYIFLFRLDLKFFLSLSKKDGFEIIKYTTQSLLPAMSLFGPPFVVADSYEQGKVAELRAELTNTGKKDKNHTTKKNALKKIVANMTMSNNDMVALFPDIVACMEIPVLEIKKMYMSISPIETQLTEI